jgi:predicted CXXCH cytochrome family protein
MKKIFLTAALFSFCIGGNSVYANESKLAPLTEQLSRDHTGLTVSLQTTDQKKAHFVGSTACLECHNEYHADWLHSRHSKMIQDPNKDPSVLVADFSTLPKDADFNPDEVIYTIGGKFKQRFMLQKNINGRQDYILGNYQWNVQTGKWQKFKPWKYWYKDSYPHDNTLLPTSKACDGCHFQGFMSEENRVEPGIGCEACHGPASEHIKNPESTLYKASLSDPVRQNEICLQCHMRNRDKRLENHSMKEIYGDARDYPLGYEAGKSLSQYKMVAPFVKGTETKEFYANGAAKKNRTQGNEFVHSLKARHGITCINCHDPHTLQPTAESNKNNDLCLKCHDFGSVIGPHQQSLTEHTHHKNNSRGSLCVECHMPKTGKHTGKSPLTVRSHLFGFTTPAETIQYKMPPETNGCFGCHKKDRDMQTLQNDLEEWGMINWDKR